MESRLFPEGTVPEYTQADWYDGREAAPHIEQGAHRGRLDIAAKFINEGVPGWGQVESVVDLGCGDGGLLTLLDPRIEAWGYDLAPANVDASSDRRVDVRYGDVVNGQVVWGELAVMTEMLEHLVDPHGFLRRVAQQCPFVVCSSPFTETAESHYEFHTWAWDTDGYKALLNQAGYKVTRLECWSMFQVVLGVRQ